MHAESNIAVIEELFREFARRDDALTFEIFDDELIFDTREFPGPESLRTCYHGHEGVRAYWRQWLDAWESVEIVDGPHHEAYGSAVISSWRQRNRGKRSGVEIELDTAVVWTFQGGRIVHAAAFGSGADARTAIGMA